jgi:Tol biopolymer transport system component
MRLAFLAPVFSGVTGSRLMVAPVDGSAPPLEVSGGHELVGTGTNAFAWSPDGAHLAFAAEDQGFSRIYVAASDGTGAVPLTDATVDRDLPSWSPDGNWISYRATEVDGVRKHLEMTRRDGTEVVQVTTVVASDGNVSRLRWSPARDARTYAMSLGFGTQARVVIHLAAGHTSEPWTNGLRGDFDAGVPWSPDGRYVAFIASDGNVIVADDDIDSPDYDGELRHLGPVADCWLEWSPDGTALYGGSPNGCEHVAVIPIAQPGAATELQHAISGVASWQPGDD